MPKPTATNQTLTIATKGTPHLALFTDPDVCITTGGEAKPFGNWIESKMLAKGQTTTVFIAGDPIWTRKGELGPQSDPAHDGVNGGTQSTTYRFEATPASWSKDTYAESEPVVRTTDRTYQNRVNTRGVVVQSQTDHGLAHPDAMDAFCKKWRELMKKWKGMTPEQRRAALENAANAQLRKLGVPPIKLVGDPNEASGNAWFRYPSWTAGVSQADLDSATPPFDLGSSLYHELVHAEQDWNVARLIAWASNAPPMSGFSESEWDEMILRGYFSFPSGIGEQASQDPLSPFTPEGRRALEIFRWLMGDKQGARDAIMDNLEKWEDSLNAVIDRLGALMKLDTLSPVDAAELNYLKGIAPGVYAQYKTAYDAYKSLPNEKYAWSVGDKFQARCAGAKP